MDDEARKRSNANLRPWRKGQSGNPKGRPKKKTLQELVLAELEKQHPKSPRGAKVTNLEQLAKDMVTAMLEGNDKMIARIMDRLWPEERNVRLSGSLDVHEIVDGAAEDLDGILDGIEQPADSRPEGSGTPAKGEQLH